MKKINTVLSLLPAPMFLLLGIWSYLGNHGHTCHHFPYEMTVMWFAMFVAHLSPWLFWYHLRNYSVNHTLPVKQQ